MFQCTPLLEASEWLTVLFSHNMMQFDDEEWFKAMRIYLGFSIALCVNITMGYTYIFNRGMCWNVVISSVTVSFQKCAPLENTQDRPTA
jgi:hypothetical protein